MKRNLVIIIGVLMLLASLVVFAVHGVVAAEVRPQVGDANGDGQINIVDVTATELMILGLAPVKSWADANWDGEVNMGDVNYVERIILNIAPVIHP